MKTYTEFLAESANSVNDRYMSELTDIMEDIGDHIETLMGLHMEDTKYFYSKDIHYSLCSLRDNLEMKIPEGSNAYINVELPTESGGIY